MNKYLMLLVKRVVSIGAKLRIRTEICFIILLHEYYNT